MLLCLERVAASCFMIVRITVSALLSSYCSRCFENESIQDFLYDLENPMLGVHAYLYCWTWFLQLYPSFACKGFGKSLSHLNEYALALCPTWCPGRAPSHEILPRLQGSIQSDRQTDGPIDGWTKKAYRDTWIHL